jgi:hypothetical protein
MQENIVRLLVVFHIATNGLVSTIQGELVAASFDLVL